MGSTYKISKVFLNPKVKRNIAIEELKAELKDSPRNKQILLGLFLAALIIFITLVYFSPSLTQYSTFFF